MKITDKELHESNSKSITKNTLIKKKDFNTMLNFPIERICLRINYVSVNRPRYANTNESFNIRSEDVREFKKLLQNFYPIKRKFFNGVTLKVEFIHHDTDFNLILIKNDKNDDVYESKELHRFTNPIIEFLDEHPELLI